MNDYNILREYTQHFIEDLIENKQSCNIIGEAGIGKTRFAKDIILLAQELNTSIHCAYINIRQFRRNYQLFLKHFQKAYNIENIDSQRLDVLIDMLLDESETKLLIIDHLEDFITDDLLDEEYQNFFDQLNVFHNDYNSILIIISKEKYKNPINKRADKDVSKIDITYIKQLEKLQSCEIISELEYTLKGLSYQEIIPQISNEIAKYQDKYQYCLLKYTIEHLRQIRPDLSNYSNGEFKKIHKKYQKVHKETIIQKFKIYKYKFFKFKEENKIPYSDIKAFILSAIKAIRTQTKINKSE